MAVDACGNCGAALAGDPEKSRTCEYCGATNTPAPKEVPVPVKVVHNVVHVAGGSPAKPLVRRCPHCRKRLVSVQAKGVELSGCGGCGGIWIDNANARKVLASPEAVFGDLAKRAAKNAKNKNRRSERPICAACPAVLDRTKTHGIELDVCTDHGTWFDAYELVRLVDVLRGAGQAGAPAPPNPNQTIRCAGCGETMLATSANITDEGLTCEACWRGREAEIIDAGDRKAYAEGSVSVGGALLGVAAVMLSAAAASSRR